MAVLTVDVGGTPISLNCTRGGHAQPRRVGPKSVGNAGAEESSIRAELMVVPIVTAPILLATAASLRTLFALGNQVPCSGDIFNKPGTIVCSGSISDEMRQTGDSVILNLTLYEVGSVITLVPIAVYLTNLADDDTGAYRKAWTTLEGGFANAGTRRILNEASLPTCAGPGACTVVFTDPDTPEVSFLTTAFLADGTLTGLPRFGFQSIGGLADKFSTQNVKARVSIIRAGSVIYTTDTAYGESNGGFSGGQISLVGTVGVSWPVLAGDRGKFDLLGRAGLNAGYTDDNNGTSDLNRQTITYGYTGAGAYYSTISFGGLADVMDPTP